MKRTATAGATASHRGALFLRVLAVDDQPAEFPLIEDGFRRSGMHIELLTAVSAPLALAELVHGDQHGRPHVALIDINMPRVSGFELAERVVRQGIPTILMSNHVTGERASWAAAIGVLDLLAKPGDAAGYAIFAARVLRLLHHHLPHRPS